MIAEGLIHYFENVSVSARDRFFRAYLVSTITGDKDLGRLASAWVAHVDFDQAAYQSAFEYLEKALADLDLVEYSTISRVGLVLGDAFLLLGSRSESQFWYERARLSAVDEGDQAALGAVMYNRSAFGVARLCLDYFAFGLDPDEDALRFCEMELDSAWEFQKGTKVLTLVHLINVCRARVLILRRRFVDAKRLIAHHFAQMAELEDRPNRNRLAVEFAYCALMSGDTQGAEMLLNDWDISELRQLDSDDALIVLGMLGAGLSDISSKYSWYREIDAKRLDLMKRYEMDCSLIRDGLTALEDRYRARFVPQSRIN